MLSKTTNCTANKEGVRARKITAPPLLPTLLRCHDPDYCRKSNLYVGRGIVSEAGQLRGYICQFSLHREIVDVFGNNLHIRTDAQEIPTVRVWEKELIAWLGHG